jgi:hypothetical protein
VVVEVELLHLLALETVDRHQLAPEQTMHHWVEVEEVLVVVEGEEAVEVVHLQEVFHFLYFEGLNIFLTYSRRRNS